MVWPTVGSRTAIEPNRFIAETQLFNSSLSRTTRVSQNQKKQSLAHEEEEKGFIAEKKLKHVVFAGCIIP